VAGLIYQSPYARWGATGFLLAKQSTGSKISGVGISPLTKTDASNNPDVPEVHKVQPFILIESKHNSRIREGVQVQRCMEKALRNGF